MNHTDDELNDFINLLDQSADCHVTDWEADFIGSTMNRKTYTPRPARGHPQAHGQIRR